MDNLCQYAVRPVSFIIHYLRGRPYSHAIIFICVLAAVACAVTTQYGVKFLVDSLVDQGPAEQAWLAFGVLIALIAGDNLLWRLASWVASYTFPSVTCDLRRDLFRHLTGHSPSYFMDRMPGMLTSRITATSNAVYMLENMFIWNVLPPCLGTFGAIALVLTVSGPMAALLVVVAVVVVVTMFRLAAAGKPLHHDFADKTAAVDGEMIDVIGNMPVVRAFGGIAREHSRFDATLDRELGARQRSLRYLERLRLLHAVVTVILTVGLLAWAIWSARSAFRFCMRPVILRLRWSTSPSIWRGCPKRWKRFSCRTSCATFPGRRRWSGAGRA
jgi:ATP-binding cassette, subfamily B, bacterial